MSIEFLNLAISYGCETVEDLAYFQKAYKKDKR